MNWQKELLNPASMAAKAATAPKSKASKVRTRVSPLRDGSSSTVPSFPRAPRFQSVRRVSFPPPVLSAQGGKGKKVPPPAPPTKNKAAVKAAAANLNAANLPGADLLEELAARFVLNCPEEELNSFERILFLVEQAHWYYEDFVREEKPHLKGMRLREFAELMFNKCASSTLPREG